MDAVASRISGFDFLRGDSELSGRIRDYDWSATSAETRDRIGFPPFALSHLEESLGHLADLVGAPWTHGDATGDR